MREEKEPPNHGRPLRSGGGGGRGGRAPHDGAGRHPPPCREPRSNTGPSPPPRWPRYLERAGRAVGGVRARRGPVPPLPPPPSYIEPGRGPRARESHRKSRESSRRDGEEAAPWDERGRGNARSSQWELERRGGQVSRERA